MDCEYRGAGHVACDIDTDRGGWTVSIEGRGTWHSVTWTLTEGVDREYRGWDTYHTVT